jgi:hypothetical protein
MTTVQDLDLKISELEENNKKADIYNKYLELKKTRDESIKDVDMQEAKLKELREERTNIIANSNLPKYMEISDEL